MSPAASSTRPSDRHIKECEYVRVRVRLSRERGLDVTPREVWDWIRERNPGLDDVTLDAIYRDVEHLVSASTPIPTEEQLEDVRKRVED